MKTVLVTGASGGIGQAIALEFAAHGYSVAVHYHHSEAAAQRVVEEIIGAGGNAAAFCADLECEDEVQAMFVAAEDRFGFIGTLVNNAGVAWRGLLTDMSYEEWQHVLGVSLTGAFLCCKYALPAMVRHHEGSIVNVSSMWGEVGASCEAAYSAAKAGLIGLTKALAKEDGPAGVRVNCITPGVIDTPMNGSLSEDDFAVLKDETPLERIGTPKEVASAVRFLAEHPFITGQVLGVSGGFQI